MEWFNKHKTLVIVLASILVVGLIALIVSSYIFSTRNEGERYEKRLTALYSSSVISLSTCLDQGRIAAQVTEREFEAMKEVLVRTVSARYVDENGNPTNASAALGGGQLISALQEAYPNIDQRSWQNLQTTVVGCRDEFQGSQDRIFIEAARYNEWRVTDDVFNSWIKDEFPSDELTVVTASGDELYGQSAYKYITKVIAVSDAITAFETGELGEQDLFE